MSVAVWWFVCGRGGTLGNERVVGVDGVGKLGVGDADREAEDLVHQHKEWVVCG